MKLAKNVLILCEDAKGNTWTHLGKIRHINVNLFKIQGDKDWYDAETIVKEAEIIEDGVCANCGKPCKGHMCHGNVCFNQPEWKVRKILEVTGETVKVQWDYDGSVTIEPRSVIEKDIPAMLTDFLLGDPGNGFTFNPEHHEDFRDHRLRDDRHTFRENLWSHEEEPTQNTHTTYSNMLCTLDGKWLPKSRFADSRLKWANRGTRYNLHPH